MGDTLRVRHANVTAGDDTYENVRVVASNGVASIRDRQGRVVVEADVADITTADSGVFIVQLHGGQEDWIVTQTNKRNCGCGG